jgi:hypothetical protein
MACAIAVGCARCDRAAWAGHVSRRQGLGCARLVGDAGTTVTYMARRVDLAATRTTHVSSGIPLNCAMSGAPPLEGIVQLQPGRTLTLADSDLLNAGTGFPSCVALQVVEC